MMQMKEARPQRPQAVLVHLHKMSQIEMERRLVVALGWGEHGRMKGRVIPHGTGLHLGVVKTLPDYGDGCMLL